jgi:hypothetical protein
MREVIALCIYVAGQKTVHLALPGFLRVNQAAFTKVVTSDSTKTQFGATASRAAGVAFMRA